MKLLLLLLVTLLFIIVALADNVTIVNPDSKPVTLTVVGFKAAATPTPTPTP